MVPITEQKVFTEINNVTEDNREDAKMLKVMHGLLKKMVEAVLTGKDEEPTRRPTPPDNDDDCSGVLKEIEQLTASAETYIELEERATMREAIRVRHFLNTLVAAKFEQFAESSGELMCNLVSEGLCLAILEKDYAKID